MLRTFFIIGILCGLTSFGVSNYVSVPINPCVFNYPDTSVSGIEIRDGKSVIRILGKILKRLEGDSTHNFYSKNKDQLLSMTVHAGDGNDLVSIFKVKYAGKYKPEYRQTGIAHFGTEKGIQLGISKAEVIKKLGKCFTSKRQKDQEFISYRIESPPASKTKLLERHNMPIYYAVYSFKKDKLVQFEFGFEYP